MVTSVVFSGMVKFSIFFKQSVLSLMCDHTSKILPTTTDYLKKMENLTIPENTSCSLNHPLQRSDDLKALRVHWSELLYLDLHRGSTSVDHVVTSDSSAVSNCNTHKCSIARRQERSTRSIAMSITKRLMWFTSLTVTSAGRNTQEKLSNHSTKE